MFPSPCQQWVDALVIAEDKLMKIDKEVVLIHGRDDRVIPIATSLRLLELIPRSQLPVFGQCGHWTQIEHAPIFNQLISHFLNS